MGQPNNSRYLAGGGVRDVQSLPNVQRLVDAVRRQPGITEITLASVFSPGDFFVGVEPLAWTYRIPEAIRAATNRGLIRGIPTSHPDYTSYFAVAA